jgi:hypothetical protein
VTNMRRAWVVSEPRPISQSPLTLFEHLVPTAA